MKRVHFFQVIASIIAMTAIDVILVLSGGNIALEYLRQGDITEMLVTALVVAILVVVAALGCALSFKINSKENR